MAFAKIRQSEIAIHTRIWLGVQTKDTSGSNGHAVVPCLDCSLISENLISPLGPKFAGPGICARLPSFLSAVGRRRYHRRQEFSLFSHFYYRFVAAAFISLSQHATYRLPPFLGFAISAATETHRIYTPYRQNQLLVCGKSGRSFTQSLMHTHNCLPVIPI